MKTRLPVTPIALGAILVLALLLRLLGISDEGLWGDEAHTAVTIRESWWTLLMEPILNNQPFHFLLLKAWAGVAGTSEAALRFPSLVFGVLTVGATFLLGRRLANEWVGLGAALLMAVAPVMVWYSQETRSYALQMFFLVVSIYLLVRYLDGRNNWDLAGYVVSAGLGLYTHFYFAFFIAGIFMGLLTLLSVEQKYRDLWRLVAAHVLIGMTLLPRIPVIVEYSRGIGTTGFSESPSTVMSSFYNMVGFTIPRYPRATAIPGVGPVIWAFAGVSAVITAVQARLGQNPRMILPLVTCLVSGALLILAGFVLDLPIVGRYLVPTIPLWLILATHGIAVLLPWGALLHPKFLAPAAAAAAALMLGIGIYQWIQHRELNTREDWRGMAEYVGRNLEGDEAVVLDSPLAVRSFGYYFTHDIELTPVWTVGEWPCEHGQTMWLIGRLNLTLEQRKDDIQKSCFLDTSEEFPYAWAAMRFIPRNSALR